MANNSQKSGRSLRRILDQVRLDVTTAIILLVTLSVFTLGLVIWATTSQELSSEELARTAIASEGLSPNAANTIELTLQSTQSEIRSDVRRGIILATPFTVVISGVIAFFVARRIIQPIKESQRLQKQFIQDAAHELRNPLAAVKATIQSLRVRNNPSKADITSTLDSVERQLGQLIAINENLLFLGDLKQPDSQDLTLSDLLRDVIEDLHPVAEDKNIEIRTSITDGVMYKISIDDFVQLTRNLIENAIKYSPENAKPIDVVLTQTAYRTRLRIKDHGEGIPEGEKKLITQRFYRATNVREQKGSGLGMSIVQKIVGMYGGSLDIKSREPSGTIVTVSF